MLAGAAGPPEGDALPPCALGSVAVALMLPAGEGSKVLHRPECANPKDVPSSVEHPPSTRRGHRAPAGALRALSGSSQVAGRLGAVVYGQGDQRAPGTVAAQMHAAIPGSKLVVLPALDTRLAAYQRALDTLAEQNGLAA
jgi:regulator of RNase E activity RraA